MKSMKRSKLQGVRRSRSGDEFCGEGYADVIRQVLADGFDVLAEPGSPSFVTLLSQFGILMHCEDLDYVFELEEAKDDNQDHPRRDV